MKPGVDRFLEDGKIIHDVTSLTLVNNTAKTLNIVAPVGKKWLVVSIKVTNPDDQARTVYGILWKEAANTNKVMGLFYKADLAASGEICSPSYSPTAIGAYQSQGGLPILLKGRTASGATDDTEIVITWATGGASAGGTDADGLVVTALELDA